MKEMVIYPESLKGEKIVPPSGSISHRAIICAGLSEGTSSINNIVMSRDIEATCEAMRSLDTTINESGTLLVTADNLSDYFNRRPRDGRVDVQEVSNIAVPVGYQGVPGCYSYQAALEYFGEKVEVMSFYSFRDVFEALAKGKIQYGMLPIENSTSGSINKVYDLLREYEFYIVGEKFLKIEHRLLSVNGAELADIKEVYSHQQGLLQCSRFLSGHSEWKQLPFFDTAGSAEYIAKEGLKYKACIAGKKAAEVYGLKVLSGDVQDNSGNSTRFLVIGKERPDTEGEGKVSIVFSVPHRPGTLYGILKHFAEGNCNLTKIESRPLEDKAWEYFFYIDFIGNINEEGTKKILTAAEKECSYFKLLGNYGSRGSSVI